MKYNTIAEVYDLGPFISKILMQSVIQSLMYISIVKQLIGG